MAMSALNISNDSSEQADLFPQLISHSTLFYGETLSDEVVLQSPLHDQAQYLCIPDDEYSSRANEMIPGSIQDSIMRQASCDRDTPLHASTKSPDCSSEESAVFNISWGGNDNPPAEVHPGQEEPAVAKRPPPKPRGIRKLPEPEPSEDGTVDEDVLKRRKNTHAARRSRMKKFLKIESLENKVDTLQAENAQLVLNNALLESDKRSMYAKEVEYKKRIKYLEDLLKHQTQADRV